jgi:hypothetical protein
MSEIQAPQIATLDNLELFKKQFLKSIGISLSNYNSIVQNNNSNSQKISNSAVFGTDNATITSTRGLKNVLIAGQGNIANSWNQTVVGNFNIPETTALFMVGNGRSDINRKNAFTVLNNGTITIGNTSVIPTTSGLTFDKALKYAEETNISTDNWVNYQTEFNNIPSSQIISAGDLKPCINKVSEALASVADFKLDDANAWRGKVVQSLDDNLSYEKTDANLPAAEAALSIASALKIVEELNKLDNSIKTETVKADIKNLQEQIDVLSQKISYLISSLTVDLTTVGNPNLSEPANVFTVGVGLADYAIDKDTKLKIEVLSTNNNE